MKDKYKVLLFFILVFLAVFSILALNPKIEGDSLLYVNSIEVLRTGIEPIGFIPMMILTTILGLKLIMFLDLFFHSIAISWSVLNAVVFVGMGMFFYSLLIRMFKEQEVAFLGSLFFMANYAPISFGLAYMMDIGGWFFYVASLYFSYLYLENDEGGGDRWLYLSSLMIGIGGLYKEYAFVAYVIVFGLLVFKNWKNWKQIIWKTILSLLLALGPFGVMNIYTYFNFHGYTYLDWFLYNQNTYTYQNRVVEFIKSFGYIYNVAWPLFLAGFVMFIGRIKNVFNTRKMDKDILFISLVIISSFAVLLWPVVTRVLFISIPGIVLVSLLYIQKMNNRKYLYPLLFVYIFISLLMDAFILDFVNLPF